jgi:hypothetical protein
MAILFSADDFDSSEHNPVVHSLALQQEVESIAMSRARPVRGLI